MNSGTRSISLLALLSAWLVSGSAFAQPFVHPGCLSTSNDLTRMKAKVTASAQPWRASYDILIANSHAQTSYNPNPQGTICRGGACSGMGLPENYIIMARDAAAAYQTALRYQMNGNTAYADKSVQIMNAWANTLTNITGSTDALLALGGQGYQWACAAELMRDYPPWINSGGFTNFQGWLLREFYPECRRFLLGTGSSTSDHNGTCDTHYWANWDLFAMNALITVGVVCDRRDIYDEAIHYFESGVGTGAADKFVFHVHPGYLGQWQESGRDQGHNTLGPVLLAVFCEVAWNQGDDVYGHLSNRFLAGSEYVAKYNVQPLTNTLPYVTYINCEYDVQPQISSSARGVTRPGWEMIYHHYVNRRGISAPYTERMAAQVRPEGGGGNYGPNSGGYDQIGFTTLTHSLDPISAAAVPAPGLLTADVRSSSVILSWWGSARATSYNVKRGAAGGGPFTAIATGLSPDSLFYVDVGLTQGMTNYYVVSAMVDGAESTNSAPIAVTANRRLNGIIIGSTGSYQSAGATRETVFDESLNNFFDAAAGNGQWAGLDLGTNHVITQVKYCPRSGFGSRMVGGQFQGCNVADFSSGVVALYTIGSAPPNGTFTTQAVSNPGAFRFVRYLSPNSGWGNVAEVQFHGYSPAAPAAPWNVQADGGASSVALTWAVPADALSFTVKRATNSGGLYSTVATGITTTTHVDTGLLNNFTYFYVVSAVNAAGESANSGEASATPRLPVAATFISAGAVWRYFDKTNDLGTAWRSNSFSDETWSNGIARLGYGNDGEVTKVASNRQWTTYFRRQFYVPNPTNVTTLDGRVTRDDAAVIYLNGSEIWRDTNFAAGVITNITPALVALGGADETTWLSLNLLPSHLSLLTPGWNTLAAEVHNQSLTSSDLGFDFELTGTALLAAEPRLEAWLSLTHFVLTAPPEAGYFNLQSATNLAPPVSWSAVTNLPAFTNGGWRMTLPAATTGLRFFRLRWP